MIFEGNIENTNKNNPLSSVPCAARESYKIFFGSFQNEKYNFCGVQFRILSIKKYHQYVLSIENLWQFVHLTQHSSSKKDSSVPVNIQQIVTLIKG